jgi:phosphoglycolate phosphatase
MTRGARDAVLFDLDGTLSDNYLGISRSIVHALERLQAPVPDEATLRACVGPPLRESFARLVPGVDAAGVESAILHYRERFADLGWCENVAYEGMADLLAALARERAVYVCTSKPAVFATRIVAHFGFDAHVHRVYGADLVGTFDDKRVLLRHLLDTEDVDAASATMVGDRHHDVRAAKAHGVRAIGVLWGYGSADELAGADSLATTPGELAQLLAVAPRSA